MRGGKRNNKRTKPSHKVGLDKKTPIFRKLMHLIGNTLIILTGLIGFNGIISMK